jgi:pyruvate/2-oxoglutarate dehydrogenase complex dihydrolipoamide dehydrogenase (E3) component
MVERFDAIVIGAGIAGETCAHALRTAGKRVALVERGRIGGECAYWAAISSETLLGPANVWVRARAVAGVASPSLAAPRRLSSFDGLVAYLQQAAQVEVIEREGGTFIRGDAHLLGPGQVQVGARELLAPHVVIATGSEPAIPAIPGLAEAGYWTNREATTTEVIPQSVVILGGEAHAIELGQRFRLFGAEVTVITAQAHLLAHEEPELGLLLGQHLYRQGMRVVLSRTVLRVDRGKDPAYLLPLDDGTQVRGQALVVATGRRPRTQGLGLEQAGVHLGPRGVTIDEHCRAASGIWAVGDVTGVAPLSHVAQYQARLAADDMLGRAHPASYGSVPRVIFTDPQVAVCGSPTARQGGNSGRTPAAFTSASVDFKERLRGAPSTGQAADGKLTLYADASREVLVGAWAIAPDASEWIELALIAIRTEMPLAVLRDVLEQFSSVGDVYLAALDHLASAATND